MKSSNEPIKISVGGEVVFEQRPTGVQIRPSLQEQFDKLAEEVEKVKADVKELKKP